MWTAFWRFRLRTPLSLQSSGNRHLIGIHSFIALRRRHYRSHLMLSHRYISHHYYIHAHHLRITQLQWSRIAHLFTPSSLPLSLLPSTSDSCTLLVNHFLLIRSTCQETSFPQHLACYSPPFSYPTLPFHTSSLVLALFHTTPSSRPNTPDIKQHLHCTKGLWALTHSSFSRPLAALHLWRNSIQNFWKELTTCMSHDPSPHHHNLAFLHVHSQLPVLAHASKLCY